MVVDDLLLMDPKQLVQPEWKKKGTGQQKMVRKRRVRAQGWHGPQELHETYKRYKAGLLKQEDLDAEQWWLLKQYYGL